MISHLKILRLFLFLALIACGEDQAAAERVNFAKYQTATSSTRNGSYAPTFANDGLVSNFHSFRTDNTTDPHWLQIRFPMPLKIGSAHLYLGLDADPSKGLSHFKFQFHNGSGWVDVPGTETFGNTATELVVPFPTAPMSDRFRLYSDDNGNRIVRELALFPPNIVGGVDQGHPLGTDVRLSLGHRRPATANSTNGGNYPQHAVDGYINNNARWLSAGSSAGDFIEIDLLMDHQIGSAHVYSGWDDVNAISDFDLRYWDGSTWILVPGSQVSGNSQTALVVPFASPVTTSRIRLRTATASTARIKELLLFPPRAGGYPLGQDVIAASPPTAKWNDYSDSYHRLRNSGPDLRLALVDGEVRFISNNNPRELLEWQLLLNHRDGSYRVRHVASGLVLSQQSPDSIVGEPVITENYAALPWQDWILDFSAGSGFRLVNAWSGFAVQSRDGIWADGNPLDLAAPSGSSLQRWSAGYSDHHPKKGLAGYESGYNTFNASWSYRWSVENPTWHPFWHSFNPMQWGGGNLDHGGSKPPLAQFRTEFQSSPKPTHLLGFNEPDQSSQANMTVTAAIDHWPRLEAMDLPLVAPAPASTFGGWLSTFVSQANARGYRRDYTAVHWYSAPDADALISHLQQAYNSFGRPVWLTEFSAVRWSGTATWSEKDNWNFLAEFMWRAESLSWLKRYSIFQFTEGASGAPDPAAAPRSNVRTSGGGLTPFGELYAGWDGVTEVLPHKAYHVQNRGEYERLQNLGGAGPVFTGPSSSGSWTQWLLTPGESPSTYRLVSMRDGRPLRFVNGENVSFGSPGSTEAAVEWKVIEHQHGWFFLEHPMTAKRLKNNGDGTFGMVASENTGLPIQWRFAVPTSPENAEPPDAPSTLTATAAEGSTQLDWSPAAASDVISYEVQRSNTPGGPYAPVATGIVGTNWSDAAPPSGSTYYYIVRAIDSTYLYSAPSPEASATTAHPFSSYDDWAAAAFMEHPEADTTPGGDPDDDQI
jgi:hypothetical protein